VFNKYNMHKRINVGLRNDVYKRLQNRGRFGESFSELVARVLDDLDEEEDTVSN
jgi:predicted CopG family antitoxin